MSIVGSFNSDSRSTDQPNERLTFNSHSKKQSDSESILENSRSTATNLNTYWSYSYKQPTYNPISFNLEKNNI